MKARQVKREGVLKGKHCSLVLEHSHPNLGGSLVLELHVTRRELILRARRRECGRARIFASSDNKHIVHMTRRIPGHNDIMI